MTGSGGRASDGPVAGYTISARMVDTSRFFRFLTVIRVRAVSAQQQNGAEQHRDRTRDLAVRSVLRRGPLAKLVVEQSGKLRVLGHELTLHI